MLKTTLYSAVAGGLLLAATVTTPAIAAPVAPAAPQVQKNVTDAQYYYYGERRYHRHRHYHDGPYGYYYAPGYYANPGVGIYVRPW